MSDSMKTEIIDKPGAAKVKAKDIKINDVLDIVEHTEEAYHLHALKNLKESKAMTMQTCKILTAQYKKPL
jgi:isochorismate hydrolase